MQILFQIPMKVIRYIKQLEDEFGNDLELWGAYEETRKDNYPNIDLIDAKLLKTFPSPYHARNWMENDSKRDY